MNTRRSNKFLFVSLFLGAAILALFLVGLIPKIIRSRNNERATQEKIEQKIGVKIVKIHLLPDTSGIELPADVKAFKETFIYARVNGYIKKWVTDIGTSVKKGSLLAELETPELDQNLLQARANLQFAKSNLERVESVTIPGAVSKQEIDQYKSQYKANLAIVNQLEATANFKWVYAPFDGVVTVRNIDQGTLIAAGSTQPLFKVEHIDVLRIFINVPQNYMESATVGLPADVILNTSPALKRIGKVVRTAKSLDPASRTLLTEVRLSNEDHKIMPGMYVTVRLKPQKFTKSLLIPANALITRTEGPQVAVVDKNNKVSLRKIKVGKDYGRSLQVLSGIREGEKIVINPSDRLHEGVPVRVLSELDINNILNQKPSF